jgi:2-polyprenyl-3-methyl-5-hydroxy-6-metoxy-1,4-benzoquinol methylase
MLLLHAMKYELKNNDSFTDFQTTQYYATRAAALAEKYAAASPGYDSLCKKYTDNKARLLDIGCGSGRDIAEFQKAGFSVTGADVSEEMIAQAVLKYPSLEGNLVHTGLPGLSGLKGKYGTILCSGVMQHVQTQHLYENFRTITSLLDENGIFILSFPLEYPDIDQDSLRDKDGRLFIIRPEEKYRFLIERQGFTQLERKVEEDSLSRLGIKWAVHVYRKVKEDSISHRVRHSA